jgi:hypothetical protein
MLDVWDCIREVKVVLEEVGNGSLLLVRLYEAISLNTVCEPIRSEGYRLCLSFKALLQVLRLSPSLVDLITLKHVYDDARDIFRKKFLVEP